MGVEAPPKDHLTILSGTSQNVVGVVVAAVATFVANILLSNTLGAGGFGVVTLVTQGAFVISFATRAGMDMAVLRDVAIYAGERRLGFVRVPVARATTVAVAVSTIVALIGVLASDQIRTALSIDAHQGRYVVMAACAGLPFLALTNVWLSATRGLKIMRYTLYIFWAGQPLLWIVFMLAFWQFSKTPWSAVLAYSASWAVAAAGAWTAWRRESRPWDAEPMRPGDMRRLMRYAAPRAPAALFSQLLFWTDLFVLTQSVGDVEVGVYSAALRAAQVLVLFLTSVNLMFSPFVADLHNRRETQRLDTLFKSLTRWTVAATIPIFLVLLVAPGAALRLFGSDFTGGRNALLILLAGQFVNVLTGSVGFVLIMAGRTGWDLCVYGCSLIVNLSVASLLCPSLGMVGAAIANAVTFAILNGTRLVLVKRFVGIQPYDRDYLRLLAPMAIAVAASLLVHVVIESGWLVDLLATGLAGTVVFAGAYLALGLTPAERRGLADLKSRLRAQRGTG